MTKVYIVTVLYTNRDGDDADATALVGAPDATTAINAAFDAVAALPHCARVIGGMCEDMTPDSTQNVAYRDIARSAGQLLN